VLSLKYPSTDGLIVSDKDMEVNVLHTNAGNKIYWQLPYSESPDSSQDSKIWSVLFRDKIHLKTIVVDGLVAIAP